MILNLSFYYFYWSHSFPVWMAIIKWIFNEIELSFFSISVSNIFQVPYTIDITSLVSLNCKKYVNVSMFILLRNSGEQICVFSRLKWIEMMPYSFCNASCELFREKPIWSWFSLVTEHFLSSLIICSGHHHLVSWDL